MRSWLLSNNTDYKLVPSVTLREKTFGMGSNSDKVWLGIEETVLIRHLHDDITLLLRPESFRGLLSCANLGFCHWNLSGITKFEYERKNEKAFLFAFSMTGFTGFVWSKGQFVSKSMQFLKNIWIRVDVGYKVCNEFSSNCRQESNCLAVTKANH